MYSNNALIKYMRLDMMIDKCNNNTRVNHDCKSDYDIENFLTGLTVRLY